MPAYNAEKYICEAIDSIMGQTFKDFEFIIIDDGSTDLTNSIIRSYDDPRIRYYKNEKNLGIVGTLNRGLDLCRGRYVARMDADDVSLPTRFENQVKFLDKNPNLVACGCLYSIYGKDDNKAVDVATDNDDVRNDMIFFCQFAHSMLMIRRSVLELNRLRYREDYRHAEDYKLWTELLAFGDMANVPQILGKIRQCKEGISVQFSSQQNNVAEQVRRDYQRQMGIESPITLHEAVNGIGALEDVHSMLNAYLPVVIKCKPYNWVRRNFISVLKKYMREVGIVDKIKGLCQFESVLTTMDKIVILLK